MVSEWSRNQISSAVRDEFIDRHADEFGQISSVRSAKCGRSLLLLVLVLQWLWSWDLLIFCRVLAYLQLSCSIPITEGSKGDVETLNENQPLLRFIFCLKEKLFGVYLSLK